LIKIKENQEKHKRKSRKKVKENQEPIDEAQRNCFHALPLILCPFCCANTTGAVIFTLLIGEVQRIKDQ
jgi:hypothetical protein